MGDARRRTLAQLLADPDQAYRPTAALRRSLSGEPVGDLVDRPLVPLLNVVYAQELRSKACCAGHARGDHQARAGGYLWLDSGPRASAFLFALARELARPAWLSYDCVWEFAPGQGPRPRRTVGLYWDYAKLRSAATLRIRDGELLRAARRLRHRTLRAASFDALAWRIVTVLEERFVFAPKRRSTLLWSQIELNIDVRTRAADVVVTLGLRGVAGERARCVYRTEASSLAELARSESRLSQTA